MSKFCLKCGTKNKDNTQFCKKCGYEWKYSTNTNYGFSKGRIILILIIIFFTLLIIGSMIYSTPKTNLRIANLTMWDEGYGDYSISGTLTPNKNYDYLEMEVVFYDDSGAIIGKDPLVWNMNNIQKDQIVKIKGNVYVNSNSIPAKAEIYIFDSAFGGGDLSDALYNQTVTM